jgi:hypothetical protein
MCRGISLRKGRAAVSPKRRTNDIQWSKVDCIISLIDRLTNLSYIQREN